MFELCYFVVDWLVSLFRCLRIIVGFNSGCLLEFGCFFVCLWFSGLLIVIVFGFGLRFCLMVVICLFVFRLFVLLLCYLSV